MERAHDRTHAAKRGRGGRRERADGIDGVNRRVQSPSLLHGNGVAMDIAVKDTANGRRT
jgi:hypothetical protein